MRMLTVKPADPAATIPMADRALGNGRYQILPMTGREVDADHAYWAQALRDGSVVEVEPAVPNSDAPPAPEAPATPEASNG